MRRICKRRAIGQSMAARKRNERENLGSTNKPCCHYEKKIPAHTLLSEKKLPPPRNCLQPTRRVQMVRPTSLRAYSEGRYPEERVLGRVNPAHKVRVWDSSIGGWVFRNKNKGSAGRKAAGQRNADSVGFTKQWNTGPDFVFILLAHRLPRELIIVVVNTPYDLCARISTENRAKR